MSNIPTFNPLEHGVASQPLMVPKHEYNKLVGSQNEKLSDIKKYYQKCKGEYGDEPTRYQSGVLLGMEIAYSFLTDGKERIDG